MNDDDGAEFGGSVGRAYAAGFLMGCVIGGLAVACDALLAVRFVH